MIDIEILRQAVLKSIAEWLVARGVSADVADSVARMFVERQENQS